MKSPFNSNRKSLQRILCLVLVMAVLTTVFAGCQKDDSDDSSSAPPSSDSMLDLGDETEPPSSEETEPSETTDPTEATIDPEWMVIRSAPSMDSTPIGKLQPGATVDILREEEGSAGVRWALIREGWIPIEYLEQYTGPDGIITDGSVGNDTDPTEMPTDATKPNDGNTGNNNGGNNSGGNNAGTGEAADIKGIITASELNIREDADQSSDKVGSYPYGTRVYIEETKNGWGRTDKGWISMQYVYKDGTTGTKTGKGVVTGNGLNIRTGPGTNYDSVGSYNFGDRITILEQFKYGDTTWACTNKGWISFAYVYVDGTEGDGAGFGTCIGDDVNIRSGPGTQYDAVGSLNYGDDVDILFQIKIGDKYWGCIKQGWVCMDYVGMG